MKIMIDTYIIISAALFPNGRAAQAFFKAIQPPYQPILNIPAFVSVVSGQKETAESLIDW